MSPETLQALKELTRIPVDRVCLEEMVKSSTPCVTKKGYQCGFLVDRHYEFNGTIYLACAKGKSPSHLTEAEWIQSKSL